MDLPPPPSPTSTLAGHGPPPGRRSGDLDGAPAPRVLRQRRNDPTRGEGPLRPGRRSSAVAFPSYRSEKCPPAGRRRASSPHHRRELPRRRVQTRHTLSTQRTVPDRRPSSHRTRRRFDPGALSEERRRHRRRRRRALRARRFLGQRRPRRRERFGPPMFLPIGIGRWVETRSTRRRVQARRPRRHRSSHVDHRARRLGARPARTRLPTPTPIDASRLKLRPRPPPIDSIRPIARRSRPCSTRPRLSW